MGSLMFKATFWSPTLNPPLSWLTRSMKTRIARLISVDTANHRSCEFSDSTPLMERTLEYAHVVADSRNIITAVSGSVGSLPGASVTKRTVQSSPAQSETSTFVPEELMLQDDDAVVGRATSSSSSSSAAFATNGMASHSITHQLVRLSLTTHDVNRHFRRTLTLVSLSQDERYGNQDETRSGLMSQDERGVMRIAVNDVKYTCHTRHDTAQRSRPTEIAPRTAESNHQEKKVRR